jgi:hypothetical protein
MTRKKISIKPKGDLRKIEQQIDDWVLKDSEPPALENNVTALRAPDKQDNEFRFTFFMPVYLHKKIKRFCVDNEISMKDKLVEILEREFPEEN